MGGRVDGVFRSKEGLSFGVERFDGCWRRVGCGGGEEGEFMGMPIGPGREELGNLVGERKSRAWEITECIWRLPVCCLLT